MFCKIWLNTMKPEQMGDIFSDNIFQNILWKEIYAFWFKFHEKLSIKTCSQ